MPISTQVSVVRLTNIEGQPNGVKMNDYPSPRITDYFAIIHSDSISLPSNRSQSGNYFTIKSQMVFIQWSIDGYFYAIQIAQYALVAYTKNATDSQPQRVQNFLLEKNSKNCDWSEEILSFDSNIIGNDETSCTLNINEPKLFKLQIVSI